METGDLPDGWAVANLDPDDAARARETLLRLIPVCIVVGWAAGGVCLASRVAHTLLVTINVWCSHSGDGRGCRWSGSWWQMTTKWCAAVCAGCWKRSPAGRSLARRAPAAR